MQPASLDRSIRFVFASVILVMMSAWLLSVRHAASNAPMPTHIDWSPADRDQPIQTIDIAPPTFTLRNAQRLQASAPACTREAVREASRQADQEAKSLDVDQFCGCVIRLARARISEPRTRCYSVWAYRR